MLEVVKLDVTVGTIIARNPVRQSCVYLENILKIKNIIRGHSSVGRAVALQAIGQGFESPCLQASAPQFASGPVAQLVRACA
jgi:hypothetical protein